MGTRGQNGTRPPPQHNPSASGRLFLPVSVAYLPSSKACLIGAQTQLLPVPVRRGEELAFTDINPNLQGR